MVEVFEGCGMVQDASDQRQVLVFESSIIVREMGTLDALQNQRGLICKAIDHGVRPLQQVLDHAHVLALFFKPHQEGHHMGGLAGVTTEHHHQTGEEKTVDAVEVEELFSANTHIGS